MELVSSGKGLLLLNVLLACSAMKAQIQEKGEQPSLKSAILDLSPERSMLPDRSPEQGAIPDEEWKLLESVHFSLSSGDSKVGKEVMLLGNSQCMEYSSDFPVKLAAEVKNSLGLSLDHSCNPGQRMAPPGEPLSWKHDGKPTITSLELAKPKCPLYAILFGGTSEAGVLDKGPNGLSDDKVSLFAPAFLQGMKEACPSSKVLMVRPPSYSSAFSSPENNERVQHRLDLVKTSMEAAVASDPGHVKFLDFGTGPYVQKKYFCGKACDWVHFCKQVEPKSCSADVIDKMVKQISDALVQLK